MKVSEILPVFVLMRNDAALLCTWNSVISDKTLHWSQDSFIFLLDDQVSCHLSLLSGDYLVGNVCQGARGLVLGCVHAYAALAAVLQLGVLLPF